jgi:hypothetical protein
MPACVIVASPGDDRRAPVIEMAACRWIASRRLGSSETVSWVPWVKPVSRFGIVGDEPEVSGVTNFGIARAL